MEPSLLLSPPDSSDVALWIKVIISLSVGGFLGLVGGLVGLVLGSLRLPAVFYLLGSAPVAAGTNIGVSGLDQLGGAWRHWREGRVHRGVFLVMGPASFLGAFLGGFFSHRVPAGPLLALIAAAIGYSGLAILRQAQGASHRSPSPQPGDAGPGDRLPHRQAWREAAIGLGIGGLGGLVGLILGVLRLPAMLLVLRMPLRTAVGTNVAVGAFTGLFGLAGHLVGGRVDWPVLLLMGGSSALGAYFGARWTGRLSQAVLLRAVGVVLLVVAGSMVWQAVLEW